MIVTLDGKEAGRRPAGAPARIGAPATASVSAATWLEGVRGLLFELGGVLYDDTLWHRWLVNLLRRLGVEITFRSFCVLWRDAYQGDVHRGRREYNECLGEFLRAVGLSGGQVDEVIVAGASRHRDLAAPRRPLPGVAKTLLRLHAAGLALGVLTDGTEGGWPLEEQLSALGVGGCFDVVVSSRETGCTKPDPRCYDHALRRLGLPADCVVFVGSDAGDLQGATAAGLATVAVNFEGDVAADVHAARFDDLLRIIRCPAHALAG